MKIFDFIKKKSSSRIQNDYLSSSSDAKGIFAEELQVSQNDWADNRFDVFQFFRFLKAAGECIHKAQNQVSAAVKEVLSRAEVLQQTIENAERQFKHSRDALSESEATIVEDLRSINSKTEKSLTEVNEAFSSQIDKASGVLEAIENIARELKIIVINVSIEASRMGSEGASIKSIALKIGGLAEEAMTSAQHTKSELNLKIVGEKLKEFQEEMRACSENSVLSVAKGVQTLRSSFDPIAEAFEHIKSDQQNIFEVKKIDGYVKRSIDRISLIQDCSEKMAKAVREDGQEPNLIFEEARKACGISQAGSRADQLEEIKQRGILRVAIEPSFVGLSFRQNSSELQGLDVSYAESFAKNLGVSVEFVEGPWDQCPEFLTVPPSIGTAKADLMWSALIPDPTYSNVSFSDPYCKFEFVLARRSGDRRIRGLGDLEGKVLGCINDPAVFALLEQEGVRWKDNESIPGGKVRLSKLQKYSDQSLIHDCLAEGLVDGFIVDLPIYHWAASDASSPWFNKVEIIDRKIGPSSFVYSVGVNKSRKSLSLLREINDFIKQFGSSESKRRIDQKWLGHCDNRQLSLRDFATNVCDESELAKSFKSVSSVA